MLLSAVVIIECYFILSPCLTNAALDKITQHVPVRILRQRIKAGLQPDTNFATVVTDLTTCHNTWFYSGVDRCYVATEETRNQALSLGMKVSVTSYCCSFRNDGHGHNRRVVTLITLGGPASSIWTPHQT